MEGEEILHKEYKENLTLEDGMKLAVKTLQTVLKENFSVDRVDCVYIKKAKKEFTRASKQKLSQVYSEVKREMKKRRFQHCGRNAIHFDIPSGKFT